MRGPWLGYSSFKVVLKTKLIRGHGAGMFLQLPLVLRVTPWPLGSFWEMDPIGLHVFPEGQSQKLTADGDVGPILGPLRFPPGTGGLGQTDRQIDTDTCTHDMETHGRAHKLLSFKVSCKCAA